ncbi:EamA family transporter RarD [Actinomycetaceae bacterium L2_0104]
MRSHQNSDQTPTGEAREPSSVPSTTSGSQIDPRSLLLGITVYIMWGFFPLYFHSLGPAGSLEVIVHRAIWGLISCILVIALFRRWGTLRATLADREALWRLSLAGLLIVVNWTTYVYAVQSGHTVDAALGYFINPLVTVALARFVLKERLSPLQKISVGLGVLAVVVLIVGLGRLPWVSLVLAFSFGFYSLVKKRVANRVPPLEGMAIETAAVTPILGGYYVYLVVTGTTSFHVLAADSGSESNAWVWHLLLLIGAGILTMIPLLLFARASRGLPLGVMGLIQYIGPCLQLIIGIAVFHEHMEPARWIGTAIIWLALIVMSADWAGQIVSGRRRKLAERDEIRERPEG